VSQPETTMSFSAESDPFSDAALRRALMQRLESLQRAGVRQLVRPASRTGPPANSPEKRAHLPEPEVAMRSSVSSPTRFDALPDRRPGLSLEDRRRQLDVLQQQVARCTRCPELVRNRTQTVFGVGNPEARLVFFGEGPGADEDRLGEPFVGRAGQLLNDIISKGMGMKREDVYIMNVVKCRPPGNRNPTGQEAESCREFFEQQLKIIQPEFICCLGAVAATTLLETNQAIGRLRGRLHDYYGIHVLATYHPAYLLRNPSAKKEVWKDIQLLMGKMGLSQPK
jgi:DNA polymerase